MATLLLQWKNRVWAIVTIVNPVLKQTLLLTWIVTMRLMCTWKIYLSLIKANCISGDIPLAE